MKLWLIFFQGYETTWLEAAWNDQSTAENPDGWQLEVTRCKELAAEEGYEIRIVSTEVAGVYELFDAPELKASAAEQKGGGS